MFTLRRKEMSKLGLLAEGFGTLAKGPANQMPYNEIQLPGVGGAGGEVIPFDRANVTGWGNLIENSEARKKTARERMQQGSPLFQLLFPQGAK
jgi:hypothetical protein